MCKRKHFLFADLLRLFTRRLYVSIDDTHLDRPLHNWKHTKKRRWIFEIGLWKRLCFASNSNVQAIPLSIASLQGKRKVMKICFDFFFFFYFRVKLVLFSLNWAANNNLFVYFCISRMYVYLWVCWWNAEQAMVFNEYSFFFFFKW